MSRLGRARPVGSARHGAQDDGVIRINEWRNDPGFVNGITGWSSQSFNGGPVTISHSTEQAHSGTHSLKVVTGSPAGEFDGVVSDGFPYTGIAARDLLPGKPHYASAWIYGGTGSSGKALSVQIQTRDVTSNSVNNIEVGFSAGLTAGAWQKIGGTWTPGPTEIAANMQIFTPSAPNYWTGTFYVDDIMVERVATDNTWFSGDSASADWEGTPKASRSRLYASTDSTPPVVTITSGPTLTKISSQSTKDQFQFGWQSDEAFVAYKIKEVNGTSELHTQGVLVEQNENPAAGGSAATTYTATITDDEVIAADPTQESKIFKVFVQDAAGNWST